MTKSETLAALALGAALVGSIAIGVISKDEVVAGDETKVEDLKAAGVKLEYAVFAAKDSQGAKVYAMNLPLADGGAMVVKLDRSPCARRPEGVKPEECLMRTLDGGSRDQGDENTMQEGWWVGEGCVQTACVVGAGEEPERE